MRDDFPIQKWTDFPLQFTVEYPVTDYEAEVVFWKEAMGLAFLSFSEDYAIVKHPDANWTFSLMKVEEPITPQIKIQLYTDRLDDSIAFLKERQADFQIIHHSPNQRFLSVTSPNGYTVEIWSGWEE